VPTRASQRYSRDCCLAHSITDYTEIMRASHTTIASRVRGHAFGMLVIAEAMPPRSGSFETVTAAAHKGVLSSGKLHGHRIHLGTLGSRRFGDRRFVISRGERSSL
jgi:hypothetical protein